MKNIRLMPLLGGLLAACATVCTAQTIQILNQSQYALPGDFVSFPIVYKASLPANQSVAGFTLQVNPGGPAPLPVVTGMSNEGLQVNSNCLLVNSFTSNGSAVWSASPSGFPNSGLCGSHTVDYTIATYTGQVQSYGPGGKITFGFSGSNGVAQSAGGVQICQPVPVTSIVPTATTMTEGDTMTLTVYFDGGVPSNCSGFAIPVTLTGPASLAPDNVSVIGGTCSSVPESASSCTVIIQGVDDPSADGNKELTVSITPAASGAGYWMAAPPVSTVISVLDNESSVSVNLIRDGSETGPISAQFALLCIQGTAAGAPSSGVVSLAWGGGVYTHADDADVLGGRPATINVNCTPGAGTLTVLDLPVIDDPSVEGIEYLTEIIH